MLIFITSWKGMFLLFLLGICVGVAIYNIRDNERMKAKQRQQSIKDSGAHPTIHKK